MTATDTFIACDYSFAAECEYSGLKAKDFVSVLCYQLVRPPNTASFGRNVVRPGQEPPVESLSSTDGFRFVFIKVEVAFCGSHVTRGSGKL